MSSCKNKNVNIENYATPPRTPYDQLMAKVYDPEGRYFAAPFPMRRTEQDLNMQQRLAPKCGYGFVSDVPIKEDFVQQPRTYYDQLMMNMYSPNTSSYHGAPFPMERTNRDMDIKNSLDIGSCDFGFKRDGKNLPLKEGYCGYRGLGQGCPYCIRNIGHPALALNDNDNALSYNASLM